MANENRQQPSCWGFTFKELKEEQAKDEDLILDWLLTEKVPEQGSLFLSSPESKYYWLNKELFTYGKVPMTEYQAGAPMERVHIDFIGPLPKTERGNEHC